MGGLIQVRYILKRIKYYYKNQSEKHGVHCGSINLRKPTCTIYIYIYIYWIQWTLFFIVSPHSILILVYFRFNFHCLHCAIIYQIISGWLLLLVVDAALFCGHTNCCKTLTTTHTLSNYALMSRIRSNVSKLIVVDDDYLLY